MNDSLWPRQWLGFLWLSASLLGHPLLADTSHVRRDTRFSPQQVAGTVLASTVRIETGDGVLGSGFVVQPGYVVTNYHVVEDTVSIDVCTGSKRLHCLSASILKVRSDIDLALLKVPGLSLKPLNMGQDSSVRVGDKVYVAGNPEGLTGTFSDGLVSAIRLNDGVRLLQISAPISHGSSGGPVVNAQAEVIGVAVGMSKEGQNLNFAISARHIGDLLRLGQKEEPQRPIPPQETESHSTYGNDPRADERFRDYYEAGKREVDSGNGAKGSWYLERAISLQPNSIDANYFLGEAYVLIGDCKRALGQSRRLEELGMRDVAATVYGKAIDRCR